MALGGTIPESRATLHRWTGALVLVAIVSLAFNDLKPILPVGEMASDAFIYTFPLLLLLLLREPGAVEVPVTLAILVAAFGLVLVFGIGLNYGPIASAYFKGRSGISRVVTQGIAVAFGLVLTLAAYNLTRRGFLPAISRAARIALVIMTGVGLLEIASWYNVPGLSQLYAGLSAIIHSGSDGPYPARLRMTAFEVSWAGVMLTFFFPFALIGLDTRSWRLPALMLIVLVMTVLAQSRTALLVVGFQIITLGWLLLRRRVDILAHLAAVSTFGLFLLLLSPSIQDRLGTVAHNLIQYGSATAPYDDLGDENVSNVTRLAAIRAGIAMFRQHPAFGVGLGQYGFNYPGNLRADDFRSWEVRKYTTDAEEDWPPSYSIHARLLAETGFLGYAVWLCMLLIGLGRGVMNARLDTELGRAHLAVALTLAGWLLLGTSIDSFRFLGGWIAVGISFALPRQPAAPA